MKLHPSEVADSSIAIFVWNEGGNCGGSAVFFGTARFIDGEFYVERDRAPHRLPIPETAWGNLRVNSVKDEEATFGLADYIVMLRLGPIPEGEPIDDYEQIEIPILNDQSRLTQSTVSTQNEQGVGGQPATTPRLGD